MKKLSFIFLMLFSITLFANNSNPLVKKDLNPETNIDSIEIIDSTKILDPNEVCDCEMKITEEEGVWVVSCWGTATNPETDEVIRSNSTGVGLTKQQAIDNCYRNVLGQLRILISLAEN